MAELVEIGILTKEDVEEAIAIEFNPIRVGCYLDFAMRIPGIERKADYLFIMFDHPGWFSGRGWAL